MFASTSPGRAFRLAIWLVGVALLLGPSVTHAKDIVLSYTPPKEGMHYHITMQQESRFMGMEQQINGFGSILVIPGERSDDGNLKMTVELSDVAVTMKQGDEMQELDLGLNGKKATITVSPRGEVTDFVTQAPLDRMITDRMRSVVESLFPFLPEDKVGEGDTWVENRVEPSRSPGVKEPEVEGKFEYTLEEFSKKDGVETVKVYGEGKAKVHKPTPGGMFVGEAEGKSESHLAIDGGWVVYGKSNVVTNGMVGDTKISQVDHFECKLAK